ncbi:MAG TPA: zf-HC2 domain-containing protein [Acidimicrobiales bacterium]|nr:zf-HC2 domain-containing protein [Acidimicrobiales bacterium]
MNPATPDERCQAVRDDLVSLATGTLTGRQRAEVVEHLERCPACAAELEGLCGAVDALMALVPDAEPPEGFAERVTARMRAEAQPAVPVVPPAARRRWASRPTARPAVRPAARRVMAAAAVVAALALGVGIGAVVAGSGPGGSSPSGSGRDGSAGGGPGGATGGTEVRTAALHSPAGAGGSRSGVQGSVVLTSGRPGWLLMTVDDAHAWGTITCRVTLADGSRRVVGRYPMEAGYGSWAARLPVPASSVHSVEVVGRGGATLAVARLPGSGQA